MAEMRLINANALRQRIIKDYRKEFFGSVLWNILDDMPTIDAEPVVRCRECRRHLPSTESDGFLYCRFWRTRTLPSGFCHMGARKDGGVSDA